MLGIKDLVHFFQALADLLRQNLVRVGGEFLFFFLWTKPWVFLIVKKVGSDTSICIYLPVSYKVDGATSIAIGNMIAMIDIFWHVLSKLRHRRFRTA